MPTIKFSQPSYLTHHPIHTKTNSKTLLMGICGFILFSPTVQAAVTLQVDDHIKVTAIDGETVNTGMFKRIKKSFTLPAGTHSITAKYDRLYDLRHDEHDYLRSHELTISNNFTDNTTYQLVMPNQPDDYRSAKKYVQSPSLAIMLGNTVVVQTKQSAHGNDGFLTNLFGVNTGKGKQTSEQTTNQAKQMAPQQTASSTTDATLPTSPSRLDQFMQLWLQATSEERDKIRSWVAQ